MPLTRLPNRACARVGHLRCPDITLLERGGSSGDEGGGGGEESDDGGGELHARHYSRESRESRLEKSERSDIYAIREVERGECCSVAQQRPSFIPLRMFVASRRVLVLELYRARCALLEQHTCCNDKQACIERTTVTKPGVEEPRSYSEGQRRPAAYQEKARVLHPR